MASFASTPTRTRRFLHHVTVAALAICGFATGGSAQSTDGTLRVAQWNIHKTKGSDGVCNPDRTANTIVALNVDVIGINEVNFFSGTCAWDFDMGERLRSLVQQKSGVTWYIQRVNAGGVGNILLSRYQPASSSQTLLSFNRGIAHMAIVMGGRTVHFFATHVDYENASWRTLQIGEAIQWIGGFAEPKIVMGDFNTWPGTTDYYLIANPYQDSWVAAQSLGTATSYNGTGATHGTSRFDYLFYSRSAALALRSVNVPDTRVNGIFPSDHDPVVAVFKVNGDSLPRRPNAVRVLR